MADGGILKDTALDHGPTKAAKAKAERSTMTYRKDRADKGDVRVSRRTKKQVNKVAKALQAEFWGPGKVGEEKIPEVLLPVASILEKGAGELTGLDLETMFVVGQAVKRAQSDSESILHLPPGSEALKQKTLFGSEEVNIIDEMQDRIMMDLTGEHAFWSMDGIAELEVFGRRLTKGIGERVNIGIDDPQKRAEEVFKLRQDVNKFSEEITGESFFGGGLEPDKQLRVATQYVIARGEKEIAKLRDKTIKETDADLAGRMKESSDGKDKKIGELAGDMAGTLENALKASALWKDSWKVEDFWAAMKLEGTGIEDMDNREFAKVIADSLGMEEGNDRERFLSLGKDEVLDRLREAGPWATSDAVGDLVNFRLGEFAEMQTAQAETAQGNFGENELIEKLKGNLNLEFNDYADQFTHEMLSALIASGKVTSPLAWLKDNVFKKAGDNEEEINKAAKEFLQEGDEKFYKIYRRGNGHRVYNNITVSSEHKDKWSDETKELFGKIEEIKAAKEAGNEGLKNQKIEGFLDSYGLRGDDVDEALDRIGYGNLAVASNIIYEVLGALGQVLTEEQQESLTEFLKQ